MANTIRIRKKATSTDTTMNVLVLMNTGVRAHRKCEELLLPYLAHFGIPHSVLDIGKNELPASLSSYALVIIGHPSVSGRNPAMRSQLSEVILDAVAAGSGLASFDPALLQEVTSGRGDDLTVESLQFADCFHYITKNRSLNESVKLLSPIPLPTLEKAIFRTLISGNNGNVFLAVAGRENGRMVHWSSMDWMHSSVLGPVAGLDDILWKSFVWAARKPFAMRGLPPLVTMRVDDVAGRGILWRQSPLYWVRTCARYGFKPWLGLFLYNLTPETITELRGCLRDGEATAFPHAFGRPPRSNDSSFWYNPNAIPFRSDNYDEFIYFDHTNRKPWPKGEAARGLKAVDEWYAANPNLPISTYAVPHWYELGENTVSHMVKQWKCEFIAMTKEIDRPYIDDEKWIKGGPFRLHEEPQSSKSKRPAYYADFVKIGGHEMFNCLTEIRDDAGYEWAPDMDVRATVGRGVRQLRRALDSMAMASLFTHETDFIYKIKPITWEQEISQIAEGIADFSPRCVTTDEALKIVRATKTSALQSVISDSKTGIVKAEFTGNADTATGMYLFTGPADEIRQKLIDVPAFDKNTTVEVQAGA